MLTLPPEEKNTRTLRSSACYANHSRQTSAKTDQTGQETVTAYIIKCIEGVTVTETITTWNAAFKDKETDKEIMRKKSQC